MSKVKLNVLYIYSCGEYPPRKTVSSFIYSFEKYSDHRIFYHNLSFAKLPFWYRFIDFDIVIYSHFITTPWHRVRYAKKIKYLKKWIFPKAKKVAFFQDEYFNTDLTASFINELNINDVFSVAPQDQWPVIYNRVLNERVKFHHYLTGYVDEKDLESFGNDSVRDIDIGYRTGWQLAGMYRLGSFGALKFKIAKAILDINSDLRLDIKIGEGFLKGEAWLNFLSRCRYSLGVESGASLLDSDGKISECITKIQMENKQLSFEECENTCFPGLDGNLSLKAISPRVFESAAARCGLILVEGNYNGILEPHVHYISVKPDFSNLDKVISKVKDEVLRETMVERTFNDLILSGKYSYSTFIRHFFKTINVAGRPSESSQFFLCLNRANDKLSWLKVAAWEVVSPYIRKWILKP